LQLVNNIQPNFLSILDPFVAVLGYNYHFIWNIWNLETKSTSLVNASLPFSSSVKLATLMAQLRLYLECKKLLLLGEVRQGIIVIANCILQCCPHAVTSIAAATAAAVAMQMSNVLIALIN